MFCLLERASKDVSMYESMTFKAHTPAVMPSSIFR